MQYIAGMKHLDGLRAWAAAFPFGGEIRQLTPPEPYIAYRARLKRMWIFIIPGMVLELAFSHPRPFAVCVAIAACFFCAVAVAVRACILYVLAWDELQRRALAESGAIAALVTIAGLGLYAYLEALFRLQSVDAIAWFGFAAAAWLIALPLVRRHYEA